MNLESIITDVELLSSRYIFREGYVFTSLANIGNCANIYDAIVIRNPIGAQCFSPKTGISERSLEEHIQFINQHRLDKALVIADNIDFITQCPSLKYLQIVPSDNAENNFDFSPLYKMPEIRSLFCLTEYGYNFQNASTIDYSKISGLLNLNIVGRGNMNYNQIDTLRNLNVTGFNPKSRDLTDLFSSSVLKQLTLVKSGIISLRGIGTTPDLVGLDLWYNRSLEDMEEIGKLAPTLKSLSMDACGKVKDFSFLYKLENLEYLELNGSNNLPSLSFLRRMKNLKSFIFSMNVKDGDISPCLDVPYVYSKCNRKHYNLTDKELPKNIE